MMMMTPLPPRGGVPSGADGHESAPSNPAGSSGPTARVRYPATSGLRKRSHALHWCRSRAVPDGNPAAQGLPMRPTADRPPPSRRRARTPARRRRLNPTTSAGRRRAFDRPAPTVAPTPIRHRSPLPAQDAADGRKGRSSRSVGATDRGRMRRRLIRLAHSPLLASPLPGGIRSMRSPGARRARPGGALDPSGAAPGESP